MKSTTRKVRMHEVEPGDEIVYGSWRATVTDNREARSYFAGPRIDPHGRDMVLQLELLRDGEPLVWRRRWNDLVPIESN